MTVPHCGHDTSIIATSLMRRACRLLLGSKIRGVYPIQRRGRLLIGQCPKTTLHLSPEASLSLFGSQRHRLPWLLTGVDALLPLYGLTTTLPTNFNKVIA